MSNDKARLVAEMALARASAWTTLLSLPEAILSGQLVAGEWTIKDTLAHMAFWDRRRGEHLSLMLAGRAAEIDFSDPDPINAQVYHERSGWSLAQVVDEAQAAREHFLAVLAPLGDGDMDRSFDIGPGRTVTVREWIERRPRHDLGHMRPVQEWRDAARPARVPGPKSVLRAALQSARAALLAIGELIPEAERATRPVCGVWSWQAVVGHVADWEYHSIESLRKMEAGGRIDVNPNEEEWNHTHAAGREGEPFFRTWSDFLQAREDLSALLERTDDARLARPASTSIGFLSHNYFWYSVCAEHDLEHADSCRSVD